MKDEKKNTSPKITPQGKPRGNSGNETDEKRRPEAFVTTAEKAQYEVFLNGALPKETIEKWIRQDLNAIASFVHGILNDPDIFPAVVDLYYKKYQALHTNDKDHEPKRTTTGKP